MPRNSESKQRFEECVNSCADSLYRVAFRLTGNQASASELVQETYLQAWRGLDSLSDPDRMRSWMFAILRNQYSKLVRREATEKKTQTAGDDLDQFATAPPTTTNETADTVQYALSKLADNFKLPLLMVAMEGMSVDEASSVLDLPRGTVLSRLHRARQKMKQILQRDELPLNRVEDADGI